MCKEDLKIIVTTDGKVQCCDDPECDGKCLPKFSPDQLLDAFTRMVIPILGFSPFWKAELVAADCSCTNHPRIGIRVSVDPLIEQLVKDAGLDLETLEAYATHFTKILGDRNLIPEPYLPVVPKVEAQDVLGTITVKTLDPRRRTRHK